MPMFTITSNDQRFLLIPIPDHLNFSFWHIPCTVTIDMFDYTLLPMNLKDGRYVGDLPGFLVFRAPSKRDLSREKDICVMLLHSVDPETTPEQLRQYGKILADGYFNAKGSFTMGITSAGKALSRELKTKHQPEILANLLIIRGNTLLIGHAGPVNTTVIYSDHVDNFTDLTAEPISGEKTPVLRFSQTVIHNGDLILLSPQTPEGWTNDAILQATNDSPLDVIRYLLDISQGNLQTGVIQIKNGKGEFFYKTKQPLTMNISPEIADRLKQDTDSIYTSERNEPSAKDRPLFIARKINPELASKNPKESETEAAPDETEVPLEESEERIPEESPQEEKKEMRELPEIQPAPREKKKKTKTPHARRKRNWKKFALMILCGLFVPLVVTAGMFMLYTKRSNSRLHTAKVSESVTLAQEAMDARTLSLQEHYWFQTLDTIEEAENYGTSPAARELKSRTLDAIDHLSGSLPVIYRYGNAAMLPNGVKLTDFAAGDQYTYALDSGSGSVFRFVMSGSGLVLDESFSCKPGSFYPKDYAQELSESGKDYRFDGDQSRKITVGPLRGFVLLPEGNPQSDVVAGFDKDMNILYCSALMDNTTGKLAQAPRSILGVDAVTFTDRTLYLLDTRSSSVYKYAYNEKKGFIYEPESYFGSYAPELTDVIDFEVCRDHSYFLRKDGTLIYCDYTTFRPKCENITQIEDKEKGITFNLAERDFRKLMINRTPDISLYMMDARLRQIINLSVKLNYIRTIGPDRERSDSPMDPKATGFGITGQNMIVWAYGKNIYSAPMP